MREAGSVTALTRVLIAATAIAGGMYLLGAVAVSSAPEVTAPPMQVLAWLRNHQDATRFYAWTATVGAFFLAVSLGIVRGLLPKPHSDVFLLGAAAFIIETAVQAWFWAALVLHLGSLRPATARTVLDLASFWGPVLTGATTAMIGAVTALGLRTPPLIPRWLTVLGAVAFIEQAIETVTVFGTHGFIAPGGEMNLLLGGALTLFWLGGLVVWAVLQLARVQQPGSVDQASSS